VVKKLSLSRNFVICLLAIIGITLYSASDKRRNYIWSDAEGYYMYLPALLIHGGFDQVPVNTPQFQRIKKTGKYYTKYTGGVALMQLPFFVAAMGYAQIMGYSVDGYDLPFGWFMLISALCYVLSGLYVLFRSLSREYSFGVSVVAILVLYFGTNLMFYSDQACGMAHAYGFFLWAVVVRLTPQLYTRPAFKIYLLMALSLSLLIFIRPSNLLAVFYIIAYDLRSLRTRAEFLLKHWKKWVLLPLPLLLLFIAQIILWHDMLGEWVYYSYHQEPGFIYWAASKMTNVLFHVHNGLFVYAPILGVAIIGLLWGALLHSKGYLLAFVILGMATYIFGSWWAWWFGGAYGHRSYVDLLPLFAPGLALVFNQIISKKSLRLNVVATTLVLLCTLYSVGMTLSYTGHWDGDWAWPDFWMTVRSLIYF